MSEKLMGSYDVASENIMTFEDVVRLHISTQKDFVDDIYEDIEEKEVGSLFENTNALPPALRNFVRWQNEIAYRDSGEILAVVLPAGIEQKYAIKGARLKELKSEIEKRERIRRFLEEFAEFIQKLWAALAIINSSLAYLDRIEEDIDRKLKTLAPADAQKFDAVKSSIQESREKITNIKEDLEENRMPHVSRIVEMEEEVRAETTSIYDRYMAFLAAFKNRFGRKKKPSDDFKADAQENKKQKKSTYEDGDTEDEDENSSDDSDELDEDEITDLEPEEPRL